AEMRREKMEREREREIMVEGNRQSKDEKRKNRERERERDIMSICEEGRAPAAWRLCQLQLCDFTLCRLTQQPVGGRGGWIRPSGVLRGERGPAGGAGGTPAAVHRSAAM